MRKPSAPTLDTVAAHAQVGRGTVSRVINGSPQVSTKAREAVNKAIAELGYVPNQAARTLVTRRTGAVTLVIPESEDQLWGVPHFAGVVKGITRELADAGMRLMLTLASTPEERDQLESYLLGRHVDGCLLISMRGDDPLPERLQDFGLPVVVCGAPFEGSTVPYVDSDNRDGARQAVARLVSRGCRRIATIAGPQDMSVGIDRLAGYREVLYNEGMDPDEALVTYGDFNESSGITATRQLCDNAHPPDGIFAASDGMAVGAIRVLRERGLEVPDDVAVIGFDDSPAAQHHDPPLSSVRQLNTDLGREMTRILLDRLNAESFTARQTRILPTELVVRSTG